MSNNAKISGIRHWGAAGSQKEHNEETARRRTDCSSTEKILTTHHAYHVNNPDDRTKSIALRFSFNRNCNVLHHNAFVRRTFRLIERNCNVPHHNAFVRRTFRLIERTNA